MVFPGEPRKRLELVLDADDPDAPIRELRVPSGDSLWHAASGLRTGMTLAELVALNGAPVSFYGLGWDYGGTVQDWHGGTLANGVGERLFHRVTLAARGYDVALATDHFGHIALDSCIRIGRALEPYTLAWIEDLIP